MKNAICFCLLAWMFLQGSAQAHQGPGANAVTISIHDHANVPAAFLIAAEKQANRIFREAGLQTVWLNCGPKVESVQSKDCNIADATHLNFKILPHPLSPRVHDRNDVLGVALLDEDGTGYYAYAFYDNVQRMANRRGLGYELLGVVLAHEIGHLLLGSNAHSASGIMCPHWKDRELLNISERAMSFLPAQSRTMQDRLHAPQSERSDFARTADQFDRFGGPATLIGDQSLQISELDQYR